MRPLNRLNLPPLLYPLYLVPEIGGNMKKIHLKSFEDSWENSDQSTIKITPPPKIFERSVKEMKLLHFVIGRKQLVEDYTSMPTGALHLHFFTCTLQRVLVIV